MASASPFNFVPTQEFLEKRKKEQDGKFIRLDLNDICRFVKKILTVKHKTDIGFTFHQQLRDFMVFNKEEATEQMKLWKDLAKDGKINILEHNNMEYEMDGKMIYTLVIQPKKEDCSFCPLSLALGTMVSGFTYAYTKKENRDAIYSYVKKYVN